MNKEILRLAIPNIISNISVPLLSSVDTALMGRLSAWHIGAVGLGAMIFNFLYWNFGFLRMGTTGLTAQAYGRKDPEEMASHLLRALLLAGGLAALMLVFRQPIGRAALFLMQADEGQGELVYRYFSIRLWDAPASLMLYALMGWFFGMQNAVFPLILTIFINAINIALSWTLVVNYDMEVAGVAWGTVGAQYSGVLLALGLLLWRYRSVLRATRTELVLRKKAFLAYLRINRDIFLRTLFLSTTFAVFYSASSGLGPEILAINVILLQFVNWMSYGIDGFAYAAESLVGKYHGAAVPKQLARVIRLSLFWCLGFAVLYAAIFFLAERPLLRLFTNQESLVQASLEYMPYVVLYPLLGFLSYLWDGVFIGITASVAMRNSMALAFAAFVLVYVLLVPTWGAHGLWIAMLTFMMLRGLVQSLQWARSGLQLR